MPTENKAAVPFQREDRYIIIKRNDLKKVPVSCRSSLVDPMFSLLSHLPHQECLVLESDWPEYEPAWKMIERRMSGQPTGIAAEELEAVLHWRSKHAVAIKERDALQVRLNAADQQIDELTASLGELPPADIAHDRAYRNGLSQGYTLGIGGHEASYQQMMKRYGDCIHEALQASPSSLELPERKPPYATAPDNDMRARLECKNKGYNEALDDVARLITSR